METTMSKIEPSGDFEENKVNLVFYGEKSRIWEVPQSANETG
jgi:hypothetical protein